MFRQKGFIHNLILPALILISVVVSNLGLMYVQNQQGVIIARSVDTTRMQLQQIQQALAWCRVMFPSGVNGMGLPNNKNLPASPLDNSWVSVRDIKCPGDPSNQSLWLAAHDQLSMPGTFLNEWEYRNTAAGVFVRTSAQSAGDANAQAVLAQVATRLAPSQKNLTGDTLEVMMSN